MVQDTFDDLRMAKDDGYGGAAGFSGVYPAANGSVAIKAEPSLCAGQSSSADSKLTKITLDMDSMRWRVPASASARDAHAAAQLGRVTGGCLRTIPVKGRQGKDEKETDRRAEEMLRARDDSGWTIRADTPFEDLECLITVLVKYLETHMGTGAPGGDGTTHNEHGLLWCVGGSLKATLDGRDPKTQAANMLHFVRCSSAGWTGDRKTKIGNTCKWHAGEMDVTNIVIGGAFRQSVQLKKCTWIKCCYGKKHYGDPPTIRWCAQCEFQKKLDHGPRNRGGGRRVPASKKDVDGNTVVQAVAVGGRGGVPARALDRDLCRGCLAKLAAVKCAPAPGQLGQPCFSCRVLLKAIDSFAGHLSLPSSDAGEEGATAFRRQLRVAMVEVLAEIDLKPLVSQVDPILLDALTSRYGVESAAKLWELSAEARVTLGRLIYSSYGVGNDLHTHLLRRADETMVNSDQAALLRAVPAGDFLSCWHTSLHPQTSPQ
eukprot:SAG31_NODE_64_length_28590_cov_17.914464_18_plen_486_part_00